MIETLVPSTLAAVETRVDPVEATLLGPETEQVARAVAKRRAEFTTTRHCARLAMAKLGLPPAPIPRGERGAPQWPAGVTGSLTHTTGYRAAVVGRTEHVRSIGIDAEDNQHLPAGVLAVVSVESEREWIARYAEQDPSVSWERLLFCAKESVYKAWYPLARRWLGFADAEVTVDRRDRTFHARILVDGSTPDGSVLDGFTGRWCVSEGLILAAIAHR